MTAYVKWSCRYKTAFNMLQFDVSIKSLAAQGAEICRFLKRQLTWNTLYLTVKSIKMRLRTLPRGAEGGRGGGPRAKKVKIVCPWPLMANPLGRHPLGPLRPPSALFSVSFLLTWLLSASRWLISASSWLILASSWLISTTNQPIWASGWLL